MNLASRLADKLVVWQIIRNEDKELYSYGFWQGTVLLYNLITVIVIGLLFGMIRESIIFTITYGMIRPYAGGYHARTQLKCYLISVGMMIAVLWLIEPVVFKKRTNMILSVLLALAVLSWLIGLKLITIYVSVALGMLSLMLILGK